METLLINKGLFWQKLLVTIEKAGGDLDQILKIEGHIDDKSVLHFINSDQKKCQLIPHKVIYLDNEFYLIAEDIEQSCIVNEKVSNIGKLLKASTTETVTPVYGTQEINDYLEELLSMSEKNVRVILKVFPDYVGEVLPRYLPIYRPYMVENSFGERIFACNVLVSDYLIFWLEGHKGNIQVIAPEEIKKKLVTVPSKF